MRAPSVLAGVAVLVLAGGGYLYWSSQTSARIPAGLTVANGRVYVGAEYALAIYGVTNFLPNPIISPNGGASTSHRSTSAT